MSITSTCDDHLSPSGTIERARQAVESASRSILASRAAAQNLNREDDSVFIENGKSSATNKGNHYIIIILCMLDTTLVIVSTCNNIQLSVG